jgi:outer membrane protein TolC
MTAAIWLATSLMLASPATVDTTQNTELLEALVSEALRANPEVRAAVERLAAAREQPAQARAWPDPMVSTVFTNEGLSPNLGRKADSNLALMASQDLPPRGDRALRGRLLERDVKVAEQQLARTRRSVEAAVRRAYYGLAEARALRALALEQGEIWKQIEGGARARYAVGQGAQQDVLRVQVELTRVGQLRIQQQADEDVRRAELFRLLGRTEESEVDTADLASPAGPDEPLEAVLLRLRDQSPELAIAQTGVERARLAVELARVQFRPGLSLQAAYMNRGALDPMWQVGIGVSLPVRKGWRRAGVAEAEARLRAAESQLRATEQELSLRTRERVAQLAAARELWVLYDQGIVPQGQMAVEAALASYQAGQGPFLSVLESMATLYGDRSTRVRLLAEHARARASLEEASLSKTSDVVLGERKEMP